MKKCILDWIFRVLPLCLFIVFEPIALAGGVVDGEPVNAAITNAAFLYKNANDTSPYGYTFTNSTASTSTSTGAIVITGGLGIGGRLNTGGRYICTDTTASTSTSTGSIVTSGGLGVAGAINAGGMILGSNLSGSNSGDVTLTAVGSSPNADAASLSGQALTIQPSDGTHPGVNTTSAQTYAGVKTFSSAPNFSSLTASLPLQLDGSKNVTSAAIDLSGSEATGILAAGRFPALTGDVTTTAGSLATTVAKIQGTTVNGTTGTVNVVFSTSPTLSTSIVFDGSSSGAITIQPQAAAGTYNFNLPITAGSSGQVLTSQGGGSSAMTWSSSLANPMTTGGDLIYGGSSGTPTRLANGSAGQFLMSNGSTSAPSWMAIHTEQLFTSGSAQTYTTPTGAILLKVTLVGGGGGGGGTASSAGASGAGAGGGGGAVVIKWISSPNSTYTYTVGGGGAGGVAGNNNGTNGGATTFGPSLSAGGGTGGTGSTATSTFPSIPAGMGGAGGTPSAGDVNLPGGYGGTGLVLSLLSGVGGSGGIAPGWGGGGAATTPNNAGTAGSVYGSGGGGGCQVSNGGAQAGGNAAGGLILVEEFY